GHPAHVANAGPRIRTVARGAVSTPLCHAAFRFRRQRQDTLDPRLRQALGAARRTQAVQRGKELDLLSYRVTRKYDFRSIPAKSSERMTTSGPVTPHNDSVLTRN